MFLGLGICFSLHLDNFSFQLALGNLKSIPTQLNGHCRWNPIGLLFTTLLAFTIFSPMVIIVLLQPHLELSCFSFSFFIKVHPDKRVPMNNKHSTYPKVRKSTDLKKNKVNLLRLTWKAFLGYHSSHIPQIFYRLLSLNVLFPLPRDVLPLSFRENCLFFKSCGIDC